MEDFELRAAIWSKAAADKISLDRFTLWGDEPTGLVHCGSCQTLNDTLELGRRHLGVKNLVILSPDPTQAPFRMADSDRKPPRRKTHPGSGF